MRGTSPDVPRGGPCRQGRGCVRHRLPDLRRLSGDRRVGGPRDHHGLGPLAPCCSGRQGPLAGDEADDPGRRRAPPGPGPTQCRPAPCHRSDRPSRPRARAACSGQWKAAGPAGGTVGGVRVGHPSSSIPNTRRSHRSAVAPLVGLPQETAPTRVMACARATASAACNPALLERFDQSPRRCPRRRSPRAVRQRPDRRPRSCQAGREAQSRRAAQRSRRRKDGAPPLVGIPPRPVPARQRGGQPEARAATPRAPVQANADQPADHR